VVPTDVSHVSRASMVGDRRDAWDATERIDGGFESTGDRKVVGSNQVAPILAGSEPVVEADSISLGRMTSSTDHRSGSGGSRTDLTAEYGQPGRSCDSARWSER
jgi:hypothetical protein